MSSNRLPPLRVVPHTFVSADLCAGHTALDFINTAAGLNRDPRDWLDGYGALISWAKLTGLVPDELLAELDTQSKRDASGAEAALDRARVLRAAIFVLVHHHRQESAPPTSAVETLQHWCRLAGSRLTLHAEASGLLKTSFDECRFDAIAAAVSLAAADMFSRPLIGKFGICAGYDCGWAFLDTSPTRRRRWCDMKTCGNAAKASRHYKRMRQDPTVRS